MNVLVNMTAPPAGLYQRQAIEMANTPEQNRQIITTLSQQWAAANGVQDVNGFVTAMLAVAGGESGWRDDSVHDGGKGFGLYAEHNEGYAGSLSKEERLDAIANTTAALEKLGPLYLQAESLGLGWQAALKRMTGPLGQNPADPDALFRNSVAAAASLGTRPTAATTPATTTGPVSGKATLQDYLASIGMSSDELLTLPAESANKVIADWQGWGGVQEPMNAYEETAAGSQWFNDQLAAYDRLVEAGQMEPIQAANEFQRQLDLKKEETTRYGYAQQMGQDVLGTLEERAGRTVPVAQLLGSEPGGFMAGVAAKYGLPAFGPLDFAPVSSFPDPWETYKQAMGTAGLGESLTPVGQGMPTVPTYTPPPVPQQGAWQAAGGGVPTGGTTFTVEEGNRLLAAAKARQARWAPGGASMVGGLI